MKKTLALLITGLILLALPVLATAKDRHPYRSEHKFNGSINNHDYNNHSNHYNHRNSRHYDHKRSQRSKKQIRRELKEARRELRQIKRQKKYNRQQSRFTKHHYPKPVVVLGIPHLIFHLGW